MGQNTSNSAWKPCEDLQKTFDLCHCQQRVYNKVLRWNCVIDQILIFHHNLQINSLKILQCDFLDFFSYFVSHSWGIPMMKITGLSHLFKWENLHNWWLTKYFFAPLYLLTEDQTFTEDRGWSSETPWRHILSGSSSASQCHTSSLKFWWTTIVIKVKLITVTWSCIRRALCPL